MKKLDEFTDDELVAVLAENVTTINETLAEMANRKIIPQISVASQKVWGGDVDKISVNLVDVHKKIYHPLIALPR